MYRGKVVINIICSSHLVHYIYNCAMLSKAQAIQSSSFLSHSPALKYVPCCKMPWYAACKEWHEVVALFKLPVDFEVDS